MVRRELIVPVGRNHQRRARSRHAARASSSHRASPRPPNADPRSPRSWAGRRPVRRTAPRSSRAGRSPRAMVSANAPPVTAAMSTNGASGRGVRRPSQPPHKTARCGRRRSQKSRTRAVFPITGLTRYQHQPPVTTERPPTTPRATRDTNRVPANEAGGGREWNRSLTAPSSTRHDRPSSRDLPSRSAVPR